MLKIKTTDCKVAAHPDGAMNLEITNIPPVVLRGLREDDCGSVEDRDYFECIVTKAPLVLELVERLKVNPETRELHQSEIYHILSILDIHWD